MRAREQVTNHIHRRCIEREYQWGALFCRRQVNREGSGEVSSPAIRNQIQSSFIRNGRVCVCVYTCGRNIHADSRFREGSKWHRQSRSLEANRIQHQARGFGEKSAERGPNTDVKGTGGQRRVRRDTEIQQGGSGTVDK